jgi:hypothetical protein
MHKVVNLMALLLHSMLELTSEQQVLGEAIWVHMTITNDSQQEIVIVNPEIGSPSPDLSWKASDSAYQIGALMSFGLIQITLEASDGTLVGSKGLMPWVTPILGKRTLRPHDRLALAFDLNELFSIDSAGLYKVHVRYGSEGVFADASTNIAILSN